MSKDCNHSGILLKRNGTHQNQRYIDALDPKSVELHDLSVEDWMAFAHAFAKSVNFFGTSTSVADGNWQRFFVEKDTIAKLLSRAEADKELSPNLTLFVCFLRLIELSQNRLNNLTNRHLDFYYKEVLKLANKEAVSDKVHLLFELAKNASEVRVKAQTEVDAGKDTNGSKRVYKTQSELIVNSATIAKLKNVFHQRGIGVVQSEIANSFDGLGGDFPDDTVKWWPFGHPDFGDANNFPKLPGAKLGFAIASPILLLKEGNRTIKFTITLSSKPNKTISANDFEEGMEILLSGEKEWIPAQIITGNSPSEEIEEKMGFSSLSNRKLEIVAKLPPAFDAVVPYNKEVLFENFNSTNPVARFLFKTSEGIAGYKLYDILSGYSLTEINIEVDVKDMQELVLENDLGKLDASKPFLPFGPRPVVGSKLYIGCQEALNKQWKNITLKLQWKDTPLYEDKTQHFREHYIAYHKNHLTKLGKDTYTLTTSNVESVKDNDLIVPSDDHFKVSVETLSNKEWELNLPSTALFSQKDGVYSSSLKITPLGGNATIETKHISTAKNSKGTRFGTGFIFGKNYMSDFIKDFSKFYDSSIFGFEGSRSKGSNSTVDNSITQENFSSNAKRGFIRMSLQQSFLHKLFPRIYAVALSKKGENTLVPNEPYTPLVETIDISYDASVNKSFNFTNPDLKKTLDNYLDESLELFHEHPFGQSEQHAYLKTKHDFLSSLECKLVPDYDNGCLFIGLENAEQLQQVSLLVQVLEGSENPEYEGADTFQGNEKLHWYILSEDEWKPLNENFIVSNGTDNFLKSGIVKVSIPKEATKNNNRIPGDLFWLKVHNFKKYDAVCQMVNVHTQAEIAEFFNQNNALSHLETGLPEKTISKLVERLATLKGVSQPYSSFDGIPKETDAQFYRRVSERLRHKQRAITLWDYEHLILQKFPKIYKVNCLKLTFGNSKLSPGHVTVIVVPNIINQNVFDIYKPRISKAKRNEIQNFVNNLNTLHVDALVENPQYLEIKIVLAVKFHEGKDKNFYKKQLQRDIAKFLSPWAYEETAEINFGLTLHESTVIFYIEQLEYVDFVKDFQLQQKTDRTEVNGDPVFDPVKLVVPTNSKMILTSVKPDKHSVGPIDIVECAKV